MAVLKAEGLVVTEHGRGSFVRPAPHVRLVLTGANYRKHRDAEVGTVAAPPDIAVCLSVDKGASVIVRRRLFLVDEPRRPDTSYRS